MKRVFDIIFSSIGLIFMLPLFLVIAVIVKIDSNGSFFYKQIRVGKYGENFLIFKFRTMYVNSEEKGLLTIGTNDSRITKVGCFLRKHKIDELPQLLNVLIGNMSFVGPRPEVRRYVDLYSMDQRQVLNVKPGITDLASIVYRNEDEILSKQEDPEKYYIETIMPRKLELNLKYLRNRTTIKDLKVIIKTIVKII